MRRGSRRRLRVGLAATHRSLRVAGRDLPHLLHDRGIRELPLELARVPALLGARRAAHLALVKRAVVREAARRALPVRRLLVRVRRRLRVHRDGPGREAKDCADREPAEPSSSALTHSRDSRTSSSPRQRLVVEEHSAGYAFTAVRS